MTLSKPNILTFVDHYLPGFKGGGPIRTIGNMVDQLSDSFDFSIVTADRDLGDKYSYKGIDVDTWISQGSSTRFYRSPGFSGWRAFLKGVGDIQYDALYVGGVFSTNSFLLPLLFQRGGWIESRPVLLAPRGELGDGALNIKPRKKKLFLGLTKITTLHANLWWHASTAEEAAQIGCHLRVPDERIFIAPDLSGRPTLPLRVRPSGSPGEPLKIVFLSRINRMKNLSQVIGVLSRVKSAATLDIFGPIEDDVYWRKCVDAIQTLPSHVEVRYRGEVEPSLVEATLGEFDLFMLPTLGENYGHVIREALSSGVPVLISDRTPWRDLGSKSAGADLPLDDSARFAHWIDEFAELNPLERERMREAARRVGSDITIATANLEANRAMLAGVVGMGRLSSAKRSRNV